MRRHTLWPRSGALAGITDGGQSRLCVARRCANIACRIRQCAWRLNYIRGPRFSIRPRSVVRPWLMESWNAVNPTTWHFRLRSGVAFHNGEPFNADAVVNTLTYLTSEAGQRESLSRIVRSIAGVRALDPLTVEISTHFPNLMLPAELGIIRMVAPKHWQDVGPDGFARDPVGTGPYKVDRWGPAKLELSAFRDGWKKPGVDRVEIIQLGDPTSRIQGILAGAIDIALVIGPD